MTRNPEEWKKYLNGLKVGRPPTRKDMENAIRDIAELALERDEIMRLGQIAIANLTEQLRVYREEAGK